MTKAKHDFTDLLARYPEVIAQMKPAFTSHQFILRLAEQYQHDYVAALTTYIGRRGPFKIVHKQLSTYLRRFPKLVVYDGRASSQETRDIFGHAQACAKWKKL